MGDYVTQVAWKVTNTTMEHHHDRGLLGWLDGGMAPTTTTPVLKSSLVNRLGLNNGTFGNLLQTPKNLGLGLDISQ